MLKLFFLCVLFFSLQTQAKVYCDGGIAFVEETQIKDDSGQYRRLELNGVGLKKILFFKAFYGALYLERPSQNGAAIVKSNQYKVGIVHVLRNASKKTLVDAWDDEFHRLCGQRCAALDRFHKQFLSYFRDVKKNESLYIIAFPNRFEFQVNGNEFYPPIHSAEYSRLLQNSLFGPDASDDSLKKGLLGQKTVCQ